MNSYNFLPIAQIILCIIGFVLHMIALPATYWAFFVSRTELGIPEEHGHYGLWGLCSMKAPHFRDDCDPLDTFFRPPPHMWSAGIVAIVHAVVLGLFFPFGVLRLRQIRQHKPELLIKPKTIGVVKITIMVIAVVLSGLILLFTTLRETIARDHTILRTSTLENYNITKGWSFWIEVTVTVINLLIVILCALENNQLTRLDMELATFSFTSSADSAPPINITSEYHLNPYFRGISNINNHNNHHQLLSDISTISDKSLDGWARCNSPHCQLENKALPVVSFGATSFNNPAFIDDSPDLRPIRRF